MIYSSYLAVLWLQMDEDEERRKRRREKNKVAAARCRNKKKERTDFLQRESERLEMVNSELKAQIEELRQERQQLMMMLNLHRPTCIVRTDSVKTPESEANPLLEQLATDEKWKQHSGTEMWRTGLKYRHSHLRTELEMHLISTWALNWRLWRLCPKACRTATWAGSVCYNITTAQNVLTPAVPCCIWNHLYTKGPSMENLENHKKQQWGNTNINTVLCIKSLEYSGSISWWRP